MGFQLLVRSLTVCDLKECQKESKVIFETKTFETVFGAKDGLGTKNESGVKQKLKLHHTANSNSQTLSDIKIIFETLKKNQFHYVISRVKGVIINKNGLILTRTDFGTETTGKYIFVDYAEFEASWWYINIVFSLLISTLLAVCWENNLKIYF